MTRKQLDKHLNIVKRYFRRCNDVEKGLRMLFHQLATVSIADELLSNYIKMIEKECKDEGENIFWYIFDNDFGKNKRSKNGKVIDNTRKLLNLIGEKKFEYD